jgi:hypothetical protein
MIVDQTYELQEVAEALEALADIVEQSQMSAADLGRMILSLYDETPQALTRAMRIDLADLVSCRTSAARFAAGLRRQARLTRERANA